MFHKSYFIKWYREFKCVVGRGKSARFPARLQGNSVTLLIVRVACLRSA